METKLRIINMLDNNKEGVHIRELARLVKTSYNNTSRNIKILKKENVIKEEKDANLIKIKLTDTPLTTAYLKQVHTENFLSLPKKIINSINEFLSELEEKPLIALIFGSYAKRNYTNNSDIDLLLVFQKVNNSSNIENTTKRVSMRTNTKISPVYVNYSDFEKNFMDKNHDFSNEIRKNVIVLIGVEYYYHILWRFQK
ncbi:MAG: nucleotidyltransferase domain-containing protein [Candidatus Nanoarchaeia archaeon]|nr:nucleotidyltransferase domain-containing protein [Candidatus Nanoarchaeia archaeon]